MRAAGLNGRANQPVRPEPVTPRYNVRYGTIRKGRCDKGHEGRNVLFDKAIRERIHEGAGGSGRALLDSGKQRFSFSLE